MGMCMHTGLKMGEWVYGLGGGYVVASKVPGFTLFLRNVKQYNNL